MNCLKHPEEIAVAQCIECGKGMCVTCVGEQQKPLCNSCRQELRRHTIGMVLFRIILYIALFFIGYKLNFMKSEATSEAQFVSGYALMAIFVGWHFFSSFVKWRLVQGSLATWAIYYVIKLCLSAVAGFFIAPIVILWNLIKSIYYITKK